MKLGVFDSGVGGKAMAASLQIAFPDADIYVENDHKNVPYGSKTADEIIALTDAAIQPLLEKSCDAIVIACNSATMAAVDTLRIRYPQQRFIGLEPMVKPAAQITKTGTIAVCATPATLSSKRYTWLKDTYATGITVIEPDCSNWARMIESNTIDEKQIEKTVQECLSKSADVIVLGCTHYYWVKDLVAKITSGRATVLEPSEAIARRVKAVLEDTDNSYPTVGASLPASA